MTGPGRAEYDAVLRPARLRAFPDGQFVGQESFMEAKAILQLARCAGVGPGATVLDLCCGTAGPGRLIAQELGGSHLGVDADGEAIALARQRTRGLPCRFSVARVPPVPSGRFDVVLLLETVLAFPDKQALARQVADALRPGGRFACTLEEGAPLTDTERARMPAADTVWPTPFDEFCAQLERAGLTVRWQADVTDEHRRRAAALGHAFEQDATAIAARLGRDVLDDLLAAHRLWEDWLATGRMRKFALVAERSCPG